MKSLKSFTSLPVSFLGVMLLLTSCESDPVVIDLPPVESLVIDLSQFPTHNTAKALELSSGNFSYSYFNVIAWNTVLAVNIAIPVAAYTEALNNTPVYLGDNAWEWSYSVNWLLDTYEAVLVGERLNNEEFSMEMTLSKVGGFQNFKWFEGVIRYDHTVADWTLSYSADNPTEYLNIHFEKDYESGVGSIKYSVVDPDPEKEFYNAYIEFGIDPAFDYDAYYTIYKSEKTTNIEWNTDTKAGRVMDAAHFQDEDWHCWDSQFMDVDCATE